MGKDESAVDATNEIAIGYAAVGKGSNTDEQPYDEQFITNCFACPCCYAEKGRGEHTMMCGMMGEEILVADFDREVDSRCWLRNKSFVLTFAEYAEPPIAAAATGGAMPDSFEEE